MTAHVVFTSLDRELPATTSATIISQVIRGFIGFDGLLMSDDLSMGALSGSLAERTRAALAAGCDMALHCNGNLAEMQAVADAAPELAGAVGAAGRGGAGGAAGAETARSRGGAGGVRPHDGRRRARRDGGVMTAEIVQFTPDIVPELASDERALIVDVEGFEGPLDLLLTLARQQKVDLSKISILALADQYLAFIEQVRALRIELAADYLVMAAWLAYLKSRMLLPEPPGAEGLSAADMANALAVRLRRLELIRSTAEQLFGRPQLGREVFGRGDPEPIHEIKHPKWSATLYDLLTAYASERQRHVLARVRFAKRTVWSLAEAREALERMVGATARLDPARRVPDQLPGRAVDARDRDGVEPRGDARAGARGPARAASAGRLRADLSAQAGRGGGPAGRAGGTG